MCYSKRRRFSFDHLVNPFSIQAWVAAGLSSIKVSIPATKTPSSRSNARFNRSQLLLFTRSKERQAYKSVRHSLASARVGDVTKSNNIKLEAMVKFERESGNLISTNMQPFMVNKKKNMPTACPKRLQFLSIQAFKKFKYFLRHRQGARSQRSDCILVSIS